MFLIMFQDTFCYVFEVLILFIDMLLIYYACNVHNAPNIYIIKFTIILMLDCCVLI